MYRKFLWWFLHTTDIVDTMDHRLNHGHKETRDAPDLPGTLLGAPNTSSVVQVVNASEVVTGQARNVSEADTS